MRIRIFLLISIIVVLLTSCYAKDDPWNPCYYEEYETTATIVEKFETKPSNNYLLIPDTGYRFILEIEGENIPLRVSKSDYHSYEEGDTLKIYIEKEYQKDHDKLVNTDYYLIE